MHGQTIIKTRVLCCCLHDCVLWNPWRWRTGAETYRKFICFVWFFSRFICVCWLL